MAGPGDCSAPGWGHLLKCTPAPRRAPGATSQGVVRMDASGAAQLLLQCKALNEQRLFPSAAQLASLLVSANQQDPDAHATLGSALLGNGEHKRARNAFQARPAQPCHGCPSAADPAVAAPRPERP